LRCIDANDVYVKSESDLFEGCFLIIFITSVLFFVLLDS